MGKEDGTERKKWELKKGEEMKDREGKGKEGKCTSRLKS